MIANKTNQYGYNKKQRTGPSGTRVLLDGKQIDPGELSFEIFQRGFQYGDGLFETIIVKNGEIFFLPYHLKRLKEGLKILDIQCPPILEKNLLENSIRSLLKINELKDHARLRLSVWRCPGGLYSPTDNQAHVLLTADVFTPPPPVHHKVSFSQQVTLYPGPTSKFKTISAIPYVLTGIEKSKRNLDDLILLDHQGHISECSVSNLFWIINGQFFTPSLNTGCIAGVRRQHILNTLKNQDIPFKEVKVGKEALLQADYIFSCNVAGIYKIGNIDDHHFEVNIPEKWMKLLN